MSVSRKILEETFNAGVNWKEKYKIKVLYVGSIGTHDEPNFEKYLSTKFKMCDLCGDYYQGKSHKFYDENHRLQRGIKHCGCGFI